MSKPNLSFRVPRNLRDEIEAVKEEEGIEDRSEAARQVLRRGIYEIRHNTDDEGVDPTPSPGERLAEISTGVAGVGTVVAAIAAATGGTFALSLAVPFAIATFIFAIIWASIRVLSGRDLV